MTFNIYRKDGQTVLQTTHDVAYQSWGSNWCMPTWDQLIELVNKCTYSWTTRNGVYGYEFVGKGGNSIFLPAAGYYQTYHTTTLVEAGSSGRYWTSRLANDNDRARSLSFYSNSLQYNAVFYRYFGFSVRPVRKQ